MCSDMYSFQPEGVINKHTANSILSVPPSSPILLIPDSNIKSFSFTSNICVVFNSKLFSVLNIKNGLKIFDFVTIQRHWGFA